MDYYAMTDQGIAREIGDRVRTLRLRRDLTQQQVSEATALSLNVIKSLESGKAKMTTLIAVLRELGGLDELDCFIPEITVSPLQLARRKGRLRQRASGKRLLRRPAGDAEW